MGEDGKSQSGLRTLVEEVLADYPEALSVNVESIIQFVEKREAGKYVRVGDYPKDIDRRTLHELASRVSLWRHWQRPGPALEWTAFPGRQFTAGEDACAAAATLDGQQAAPDEVQRLPLRGCWGHMCTCRYRLVKRDGRVM